MKYLFPESAVRQHFLANESSLKKFSASLLTFIVTMFSILIPGAAFAVDPSVEPGTIAVGSGPLDVAITADGSTAYVVNYDSDNISVVNLATGTAGTPISVGNQPTAFTIAPNGTFAYVANFNNDSPSDLTRIALPSGTPTTILSGAGLDGPRSIVFSPDGTKAYVSNQGMAANAKIFVIDTATNTKLSEIAVSPRPQNMAINSDGTKLFVSHFDNGVVSFIDLSTNAVTTPITGLSGPQGLTLAGTNYGLLYVANQTGNSVNVYNAVNGTLVTSITGFSSPESVTVNPGNTQIYVANQGADQIKIIDIATNAIIAPTLTVGDLPFYVAFAPNGLKAYVPNYGSNTLSVISFPQPPAPPAPQPAGETLANTGQDLTLGMISATLLLGFGIVSVLTGRRIRRIR